MRLRNKKTGEIVIANVTRVVSGVDFDCGQTLAELNSEWEDAPEEPKEWWYIDIHGPHKVTNNDEYYQQVKDASKEVGNYFSSREEAEKAVEKLKAWKRLESHDLFISKGNRTFVNTDDVFVVQNVQFRIDTYGEVEEDLDLLFGGEE